MPDLSLSSWPLEIMINLTLSMKDCQRMKHWKHDINFGCLAEHSNFNAYSWQQSSFFPFFLSHSAVLKLTLLIPQIFCAIFYYRFTGLYF